MTLHRPRALRPGDRIAVVAPASAFPPDEFHAGIEELRRLGFEPVYDDSVFATDAYEAGHPELRAAALRRALEDPSVAGIIAARGGYGSVKLLPMLDPRAVLEAAKPIIGYSDLTSLLTFCTQRCGLVAFHGPMLAGRLSRGEAGYDRDCFLRAVGRAQPIGSLAPAQLETLAPGEASGPLSGGTLTQLAASLGTPFAFDPPAGAVVFLEDVHERPYRLDRMLTQLTLAGVFSKAVAIVCGEMLGCDEPGGSPGARDTVRRLLAGFPGPVLFGFPAGHTAGPALTLPLGVETRVKGGPRPELVVEDAAVEG